MGWLTDFHLIDAPHVRLGVDEDARRRRPPRGVSFHELRQNGLLRGAHTAATDLSSAGACKLGAILPPKQHGPRWEGPAQAWILHHMAVATKALHAAAAAGAEGVERSMWRVNDSPVEVPSFGFDERLGVE